MQILHCFVGSIQQYAEEIFNPHRYRPELSAMPSRLSFDRAWVLLPQPGGCGIR
jgi:hypothetical protein